MPALLMSSLWSGPAYAHDPPFGNGLWASGSTLLLRSNRGLFLSRDAKTFSLLCNEALGINTAEVPPILATDAGWLIGTSHGLLAASDDLCTLDAIAPLDTVAVSALARDPTTPTTIYASTAQSGFDNGLYSSDDAGATFTAFGEVAMNRVYQRLAWSSDPQQIYASGLSIAPGASDFTWFFARSTDRGATFTQHEFTLGAQEYEAALLGVAPTSTDTLFAVARAELGSGIADRFLVSEDGGATFRKTLELDRLGAISVAQDDRVWVAGRGGLWRSNDGGMTFTQLSSVQTDCVERVGSRLYLCETRDGVAGLSVSDDDGESATRVMRFSEVTTQVPCAFDSQVAIACAAAWGDFQRELHIGFAQDAGTANGDASTGQDAGTIDDEGAGRDPGAAPEDARGSGCSCNVTRAAHSRFDAACIGMLALAFARRRRIGARRA